MIDQEKGMIAYAVIAFGGFLGIGNKQFAIPWEALAEGQNEHVFTLKINKELLGKAEGFDRDKLPLTRDQLTNTYANYGNKPYWETGSSANIPLFLPASTIKGEKVTNMAGEDLGKIDDLMIDQENGKIAYVVISFGGFLGMGDKHLLCLGKLLQRDKINTLSPSKSTRKSWKRQRALIKISCL
jgi:hypothetical protein